MKACCVKIANPPAPAATPDSPSCRRTAPAQNTPLLKNSCVYCNKKVEKMWPHIKQEHAESFIRCPQYLCATFFKSHKEKKEHVIRVHAKGKTKIQCVYCGVYLINHKSQWSHMKFKHKDVAIRCPYQNCSTYVRSREEKLIHVQQVHEKPGTVKCIYCESVLKSNKVLKDHVLYQHSDVAIKCNYNRNCPSFFKNLEQRDEHIKEKHQVERVKKKLSCLYCNKELEQGSNYRNHMRFVHCDVVIQCNKCAQYFTSVEDKDEHFREKHEEPDRNKRLKCQHCDYKTNNSDCFNQHVALKHGTEDLPCPHCPGKRYKSQLALKRHIHLVHGEKVVCSHCRNASVKSDYRKHLKTDFCSICEQKVFCVGMKKVHKIKCEGATDGRIRKTVAVKKNFKFHCDLCKTSHETRKRIIFHMKTDHGHSDKLFQCSACKKYFVCRVLLKGHRCRPFGWNRSV